MAILKTKMGVVVAWSCDGCGAEKTILNGRCLAQGKVYCAACVNSGSFPVKLGINTSYGKESYRDVLFQAFRIEGLDGAERVAVSDLDPAEHLALTYAMQEGLRNAVEQLRLLLNEAVATHQPACECQPCVETRKYNAALGGSGAGKNERSEREKAN